VVTQLRPDLETAIRLADLADSISMSRFRAGDLVVTTKPDMSPVTDADKAVETAIRTALQAECPADAVLGEEFGVAGDSSRQWIIDPIDGTKNYVRGVPVWATLIALAVDGVPVVGVVSAPALGRRWWAASGQGAWTSDHTPDASRTTDGAAAPGTSIRRCSVSAVSSLADASASCSGLSRWEQAGQLENYLELSRQVWRTRDYGDMWPYMMVAEGLVDIAGEHDLQVYDMAALVPIVEEAGGRFTSVAGEPGPWHHSALATNGLLHDAVLRVLGSAEPTRQR
jgi:histidinol-phosphatase